MELWAQPTIRVCCARCPLATSLVFSLLEGPPLSLEETSSAGWAVPTQALAANISSGEEMNWGLLLGPESPEQIRPEQIWPQCRLLLGTSSNPGLLLPWSRGIKNQETRKSGHLASRKWRQNQWYHPSPHRTLQLSALTHPVSSSSFSVTITVFHLGRHYWTLLLNYP